MLFSETVIAVTKEQWRVCAYENGGSGDAMLQ